MNTAPDELSEGDFKKLQGQYQVQYGITMNKQVLLLFEFQKAAHLQDRNLIQGLYQKQNEDNATLYQEQIRVLEQKIEQDKQQYGEFINVMKDGVVAISNQKGAIITENPNVILKHNLSKYGIICTLILLLGIIGAYLYNDYHNSQEEYQKITNTLNNNPKIYKFQLLVQNAKIVANPDDDKVGEYLELTLKKEGEGAKVGTNYIEDPDENRILVPLHFSKKPL